MSDNLDTLYRHLAERSFNFLDYHITYLDEWCIVAPKIKESFPEYYYQREDGWNYKFPGNSPWGPVDRNKIEYIPKWMINSVELYFRNHLGLTLDEYLKIIAEEVLFTTTNEETNG